MGHNSVGDTALHLRTESHFGNVLIIREEQNLGT